MDIGGQANFVGLRFSSGEGHGLQGNGVDAVQILGPILAEEVEGFLDRSRFRIFARREQRQGDQAGYACPVLVEPRLGPGAIWRLSTFKISDTFSNRAFHILLTQGFVGLARRSVGLTEHDQ